MEVTMVSLRRRRLLGLCSGSNSCENLAYDENSSQNANPKSKQSAVLNIASVLDSVETQKPEVPSPIKVESKSEIDSSTTKLPPHYLKASIPTTLSSDFFIATDKKVLHLQPDSPRTNLITSPVTGAIGSSLAPLPTPSESMQPQDADFSNLKVSVEISTSSKMAATHSPAVKENQMMGAEKDSSPLQKDEDTPSNSKPGSSNVSGSIQYTDALTLVNDPTLATLDLLTEGSEEGEVVIYLPNTVARQMGLCQGIPAPYSIGDRFFLSPLKHRDDFLQLYLRNNTMKSPFMLNPYTPLHGATHGFKAWWESYYSSYKLEMINCLVRITSAFVAEEKFTKAKGKRSKEASLEDDVETTQPSKKSKKGKCDVGNLEKSSKNYQSTLKGSDHPVELASPSLKARRSSRVFKHTSLKKTEKEKLIKISTAVSNVPPKNPKPNSVVRHSTVQTPMKTLQLQPDNPTASPPTTDAIGSSSRPLTIPTETVQPQVAAISNLKVSMEIGTSSKMAATQSPAIEENQMMGAEKVSSPSLQKDEDTSSNGKTGSSNVSGSSPSKQQPSQQNIDAPTFLNDPALETIDLSEASQVSDAEALVNHDNATTKVDIAMTVKPHNEGITVSDAKDIKDVDTDTAIESIYSVDKLEKLASKLGASSHLSSPISVCSSTGHSQNQNAQRISDLMTELKMLVSKDIDSIMPTSRIVEEISLLLKSLDEIKNHLDLAEFGVFTAIQMYVGRFQSDFPNIKFAVSTYHDIHQEQQKAHKNIKELAECLSDVNNEQEDLNQQEQQLIDHRDLKETEGKLTKVRSKKETNATSRKEIESRIDQEYPKGTILMGKMTSIEADYNLALAKKKYLAENWANIRNMCNSIS